MKLLLDEMYSPKVATQLQLKHHVEAVSAHEIAEVRGRPDDEVFAYCQRLSYTLVTENVIDFRPMFNELVARGGGHCGVIFTTNSAYPRAHKATTGALIRELAKFVKSGSKLTSQEHWL
ncbi:MAG: DUF5615 family PIN-like protein [Thermoleophilaceae bacterium]|nr:DUF5615 family PIN-like protein [Thermoleophilaceae bacterium]